MFKVNLRTKLIVAFIVVALITAITGGFGIYYSRDVGHDGIYVGKELAPLGDAAMEIKLTATKARLIFKEVMSGDTTEQVDDVWKLLNETLWYCDAILKGGKNQEGQFFPSKDPRVLAKISEVKKSVENFIQTAHSRFEQRSNDNRVAAGTDAAFDTEFEKFIRLADESEELIHDEMDQGLTTLVNSTQTALVVMIAITVIGFVVSLVLAIALAAYLMRLIGGEPSDIAVVAEQVAAGQFDFDVATEQGKITGIFAELLRMCDSLRKMVKSIQKTMISVSQGDFTERMTEGEMMGRFQLERSSTVRADPESTRQTGPQPEKKPKQVGLSRKMITMDDNDPK